MTKSDLWKIDNFGTLFADPRFAAVVNFLKTDVPASGEESGDWYRGVHSTIQKIEGLGIPPVAPKPPAAPVQRPLYADPRDNTQKTP